MVTVVGCDYTDSMTIADEIELFLWGEDTEQSEAHRLLAKALDALQGQEFEIEQVREELTECRMQFQRLHAVNAARHGQWMVEVWR